MVLGGVASSITLVNHTASHLNLTCNTQVVKLYGWQRGNMQKSEKFLMFVGLISEEK